jgi:protein involved in polysaccharide export with SLBB domain
MVSGCSNLQPHAPSVPIQSQTQTITSPQYIYVLGEVSAPGKYPWTNGMTLQDAVNSAGLTDFTRKFSVTHNGVTKTYRLGSERTLTKNPFVYPGDRIYSHRVEF